MAKNAVGDWDTTASNNTDVGGISLAEGSGGMRIPGINNALRELMAQVKASIGVSIQAYSASLTGFGTANPWTSASAAGAASLAFAEDTDNGTNKVTLKGQASVGSDIEVLLPATAGTLYVSGGTDVAVADGGTNISSYTAGDLLYASGATTLSKLAKGTAAQVLQMNAGATAPEWATISTSSMTLLDTLTTTSGTTHAKTDIPSTYRKLYIEVDGVSFTADSLPLLLALSSTNGAAYGATATVGPFLASAGDTWNGWLEVGNIQSALAAGKSVASYVGTSASATIAGGSRMSTNTAAALNAIRFSGGTFDAGTIRIYGVK